MPLALDQLTLKPASEAQKIEARRQASTEWGKWLDTEGYLRRMELLDTFEHASDGKTLVWVLVPTEDQETLNVLSMCVTYRRDIFILPPNEIKAISSTGYGIASVFTPPRSRGKGYAARMMSLLHFALAKFDGIPAFPPAWGKQPPVQVEQPGALSVLYSGIGSYYSRCAPSEGTGWTIVGTKTTHWIADQVDIRGPHPKVESLSQEEAVSVIVTDAALFKRDFESQGPSSYIHFTFRPAEAWCRFQMDRDMGHPLYIERPPRTWGARLQDETGETHFIVWTYRPALEVECKLIIVSLRASPTTFPPLFATMVSVARESGHNIIEAWNLEHELDKVVVETGGRTFDRTSQLPAMKWYGPEKNVLWFGNNKLHWC